MRPGNDPVFLSDRERAALAAIGLGLTAAGLAFVFGGGPLAAGMRPHRRGP